MEEIHTCIDADTSLSSLNESWQVLGESPVKFYAIASGRKTEYGKQKLEKIDVNVTSKFVKVLQVDDFQEDGEDENMKDETKLLLKPSLLK